MKQEVVVRAERAPSRRAPSARGIVVGTKSARKTSVDTMRPSVNTMRMPFGGLKSHIL